MRHRWKDKWFSPDKAPPCEPQPAELALDAEALLGDERAAREAEEASTAKALYVVERDFR
jgi:hypothetical protein